MLGTGLPHLPVASAESTASGEQAEQQQWAFCSPPPGFFTEPPPAVASKPGQTELSANEAESLAGGLSLFSGNVIITHDSHTLQGDSASYDQASGEISVDGNVRFYSSGMVMQGDSAHMQLERESGEFNGVDFYFPERHAFGSAEKFTLADQEHSTLEEVRYTTCNPGQEDWLLSADRLVLDQQTNTGEAYNTVLRLKNVPIFYSPYLNFPLSGRKSGLLFPDIGSSDSSGTDIQIPVYWNIAPNKDATFTPRHLSERGAMLMNEYRFLTEDSSGQLNLDYLFDDELYGDDRYYAAIDHNKRYSSQWSSTIHARQVSDALYFDDLGGYGDDNTITHLERRIDLNYNDKHWQFLGRVQSYQTISGSEPYQRLPQLRLTGQNTHRPNQLQFRLESEAVVFEHEDAANPSGSRIDLKPSASLPLQGAAWFFKPTVAWRYTGYEVQDYSEGDSFDRSLPIASVDSGLFFDRETTLADTALTQTLEPRLFYLYVPYEDQDELPIFDSGESSFSFNQLFRDNRFTGADRQGDANQLTAALTSRLLDAEDGQERMRGSIGRIYYFDDRQVGLSSDTPDETSPHSDLFAELELRPIDRLRVGLDVRYDTSEEEDEELNSYIRFQPDTRRLLGLDYRHDREDSLEQIDTLVYWPLARQWQVLGRWRYDLENSEGLEVLAGVEYESCCWTARLIARDNRSSINEEMDRSYYFTFGFKGLGSLGKQLADVLGEGMLDYY